MDTLDQLMDILKKSGIELHHDFLKESVLSLVHVKNDVNVHIENLLSEFAMITPKRFYTTYRKNSITLESINKHHKTTTCIYGKYAEMVSNKTKYEGLEIDLKDFEGISRVESKFNGWRTVAKFFGTRNFIDILKQENVNSILINNILNGQLMETPQLDLSRFKTISQLSDYAKAKLLFDHTDGNIELIKHEFKLRLGEKTKVNYQMRKIEKLLPFVQNPEGRILKSIIELKQQLKE
ncbi:MAG TPA: hypothetical protein ENH87_11525 [Pricia antarctica]|uniref:Uncharacterized protein n=2 Tax=root TaxID=1 RepID=A0A831QNR5_9FLAO|nr:hypothetical protein [Pricia antarctica]